MAMILPYLDITPTIDQTAFIAESAHIIGKVKIGGRSSVWFNTVIRGDVHEIEIGARTNIQDGTIIHVTTGGIGTHIGDDVTIGHGAILHDCTLEDACFIGMGALVMDKAVIESGAMVAAGSLVPPGRIVKSGEVWGGRPAKFMREMTDEEKGYIGVSAQRYVELGRQYAAA